jgi:hypothetical protein
VPQSRIRTSIRWFSILLVLGLGATAVGLVVLGSTQKQLRIGVLVGIWAAVVAYFLPRRASDEDEEIQPTGHEIAARTAHEVAARAQVKERREYERALQRMLRGEIDAAMRAQVTALRSEVAALRSDLVENVNGQLRLERTETTRVIGSDIEALQREIRRLAILREPLVTLPADQRPPSTAARTAPVATAPLEPLPTPARPAAVSGLPEAGRPAFPPPPAARPGSMPTAPPLTPSTPAARPVSAAPAVSAAFPPLDLPPLPAARAVRDLPPVSVTPLAGPRPAPVGATPARPPAPAVVRPPTVAAPANAVSPPPSATPRAPAAAPPPAAPPLAPVARPLSAVPPPPIASPTPTPPRVSPTPQDRPPVPVPPADPFGDLPRLGTFRDPDGEQVGRPLPEAYVGRRRVRPTDDVADILGRSARR